MLFRVFGVIYILHALYSEYSPLWYPAKSDLSREEKKEQQLQKRKQNRLKRRLAMSQEERNEVKIKRSAYRKKRISSLTPAEQKEEKKKKAAYDAEYSKKRAHVSFQSSDQ